MTARSSMRGGDAKAGVLEPRPVQGRAADPCAINGCPRYRYARDWCKPHYARWRMTGNPHGITGNPVGVTRFVGGRQIRASQEGLPGNPWAGRRSCPTCGGDRWTMPRDGRWNCPHWVCVDPGHPTLFFDQETP
jgi:hypothetical protein